MAATKTRASKTKTVNGRVVSAKSKTGDPACSQAMSEWKTTGLTPAISAILGKCRAKARALKQGESQRAAGNEAKAQRLEALAAGKKGPITAKDRLAKAKELVAARAGRAKAPAARPSSLEQASAHRASKGSPVARAESLRQRSIARGDAARSRGTQMQDELSGLRAVASRARGNKEKKQAEADAYFQKNKPVADKLKASMDASRDRASKLEGLVRVARASARTDGDVLAARHRVATADSLLTARGMRRGKSYDPIEHRQKSNMSAREFKALERNLSLASSNREAYKAAEVTATVRLTQYDQKRASTRTAKVEAAKAKAAAAKAEAEKRQQDTQLGYIKENRAEKRVTPEARKAAMELAANRRNEAAKSRYGRLRENIHENAPGVYGRTGATGRAERAAYFKQAHAQLVKTPTAQARIAEQTARATQRQREKMSLFGGRLPDDAPKPSRSRPDASYGERVRATAAKLKDRQFTGVVQKAADANQFRNHEKAFISDVYAALPKRATAYPIDKFKADLFKQHQDDRLSLSRADMTSAFPADKHSASSTKTPYAEFHFVQASSLRPKAASKAQPVVPKPSLREQAAAFRASKGSAADRVSRITERARAINERLGSRYAGARTSAEYTAQQVNEGNVAKSAFAPKAKQIQALESRNAALSGRINKIKPAATKPSLKEQAAAHRASKGPRDQRVARITERARAINEGLGNRYAGARTSAEYTAQQVNEGALSRSQFATKAKRVQALSARNASLTGRVKKIKTAKA